MDKLLSGKRDQDDRDCVHGRDLIAEKQYSYECFNNMDVGVSLWLIEPRDKHPHQEFASSYPALYVSAFYTSNYCAFYTIGCLTLLGSVFHTRRTLVAHLDSMF